MEYYSVKIALLSLSHDQCNNTLEEKWILLYDQPFYYLSIK